MRVFEKLLFSITIFPLCPNLSRRDFLKLGGLSLGSLAFSPSLQNLFDFDDSDLCTCSHKFCQCLSAEPSDKSSIVSTWFRDELLHVYDEVKADEPTA